MRPDAFYRFKYEVGDFIYVVTNKGEKIIEYKERHRFEKADGADRISSFDVYYYDDIESFFNKYKAEPADIYINGEKLEIKGKLCPNGAFTVPALEILERIGMTVEKIQEPECLRVKNDKDDVYLYVLDKHRPGDAFPQGGAFLPGRARRRRGGEPCGDAHPAVVHAPSRWA